MADKTYIDGIFIKQIDGQYDPFFSIGFKVDSFIESIKPHIKNGYVNVKMQKRREPDKNGNTHYMILNNWTPDNSNRENITENNEPNVQDNSDGNLPF